jgi:hypothetical protein
MLAYSIGYFLVTQIELNPKPLFFQVLYQSLRIIRLRLRDVQNRNLHKRQPLRHCTRVILDQDADKAFERADNRVMKHDRHLASIVISNIFSTKTDSMEKSICIAPTAPRNP